MHRICIYKIILYLTKNFVGQVRDNLVTSIFTHKELFMKKQICQISLCLTIINQYFNPAITNFSAKAADFSRAQQTYVPPSYIQRGLDSLGTNNLGLPALNSNSNLNLAPAANFGANPGASSGVGLLTNDISLPRNLDTVSQIQNRISKLMQSGQTAEAENLARAGLKVYPNSSVLKKQFATITASEAQSFLQAQNYDMAGKKARESLVADPNNKIAKSVDSAVLRSQGLDANLAEGHLIAANTLTAEGRLLEASVEYKSSLGIKQNAAAHVGLGSIALGRGQIAEANNQFERALSLDANFALAYRQRGALRYILKDVVGANSDFSKAVSLAPDDQVAADALTGLWKAQVSNNPNSVNSHLGLARAYMQTNNLEAARSEYKTVVSIDPNNPALPAARASFKLALAKKEADQCVQAAKTLESQGAIKEAHEKLVEALGYCPNDAQILVYHGQICQKLGLLPEAHAAYMSALKSNPQNLQAASAIKSLNGQNYTQTMSGVTGGLSAAEAQSLSAPPPVAPPRSSINVSVPQETPLVLPSTNPSITPSNSSMTPSSNFAAPPALQAQPNLLPMPEQTAPNIPLKSPIPKTQSNLPLPFGNAYFDAVHDIYVGEPAEVTMLGNFGSCVRALIMAQKQLLQAQQRIQHKNEYAKNYSVENYNSDDLTSTSNNWF